MPFIMFNEESEMINMKLRLQFYSHLIRAKVLLSPFHHGFFMYQHTDDDLDYVAECIAESLEEIKK